MDENRKLKEVNENLLQQNFKLEQKLMRQARNELASTSISKQKVQRHKANEIILKIIRHNDQENSNQSVSGFA